MSSRAPLETAAAASRARAPQALETRATQHALRPRAPDRTRAAGPLQQAPSTPGDTSVFAPILDYVGEADACRTSVTVQNVGDEATKVVLVVWGEASTPAGCAGPMKSECSGLIKPAGSWIFVGAQVPTGAHSAVVHSLSPRLLSSIGASLDEDDLAAEYLCERVFYDTVGDCEEHAVFASALATGAIWKSVPLAGPVGAPLAGQVLRHRPGDLTPAVEAAASYGGVGRGGLGVAAPAPPHEPLLLAPRTCPGLC